MARHRGGRKRGRRGGGHQVKAHTRRVRGKRVHVKGHRRRHGGGRKKVSA